MPRFIVQHQGWAAVWSTIVDAPITCFSPIDEVRAARPTMEVVNLVDHLEYNRAGQDDSCLDLNELLWEYADDDDQPFCW